jgi:hypothetical protein
MGVVRHVGDLAGGTLGHKQVAQGAALGRPHQVDKGLALNQHALVKLVLGSGLDDVHAFDRCRVVFAHALDHIARKLKVRIALRVFARQVAHQRQG